MMVKIDAGVVSFCRQYLPNHNAGSYDDPRFKLVIDDGVNFVNQTSQTFDVIISTAPILSVPAKAFSLRHFMKAANVA